MNSTLKHLLTIAVVCWLTFFFRLGEPRLWDRDEPRNAGCAMEMLAAENWGVPVFNDELRQQKPVLIYWLIMSAYMVFGQNEFAARFWSALLGTGTCMLTYALGRRMFDATVGWLAAIVLATSLMFCVAARAATPDSVLIFCCMLAYWIYVRAVFKNEEVIDGAFPKKPTQWAPLYIVLGLAVLAKGPIGFLIPMAVVGMFMLIERSELSDCFGSDSVSETETWTESVLRWLAWFAPFHFLQTLLAMRIFAGVAVMLLVAMPWYLAVHFQTDGEFTRRFFLTENLSRAANAMEGHHGGLWFYPLAILAGFYPWSVFAGPTIANLWSWSSHTAAKRSAVTFLICWVVVQVTTFSLFGTKLPSYVTPCYPALAILTSLGLITFARGDRSLSSQRYWHLAAMVALLVSGVGITLGFWLGMQTYLPNLTWLAMIGLVPVVGAVSGFWLIRDLSNSKFVGSTGMCATVLCCLMFGVGAVTVSDQRKTDAIFERIAQHPCEAVGAWKCMEPSWVVYGGKPIYELEISGIDSPFDTHDPTVPIGLQERVRSMLSKRPWEYKARPVARTFLAAFPKSLVLTTDAHLATLLEDLPESYQVLESADLFLKPGRKLILLGPKESENQ